MKEGFSVASRLREVGYIAELALGGEEANSYGFILEVQSKTPKFVLNDKINGTKSGVESVAEVLALLGSR
jgi:hypothetical protein